MQPVADPGSSRGSLGLGDLVGVVHGNQVDGPAVDVEALAEVLHRHGAALDVPARIAAAPGRVPEHGLVGELRLREPQGEVGRVPLALVHHHARARPQVLLVQLREGAIARELRDVEVEVAPRTVGEALLLEPPDQVDHVGDVIGGPAQDRGGLAAQRGEVAQERLGVELGDLPDRAARSRERSHHLVLAVVRVAREVADVGDVHHVAHLVTGVLQGPAQDVLEDERAQVADVGVVVDRETAGVHARPSPAGGERTPRPACPSY